MFIAAAFCACGVEDGPRLEQFSYPFPVHTFRFESQRQMLEMAYMSMEPAVSNAPAVVLLHGKNFSGAAWELTATALQAEGFRVVIPDQVGFGKSSKPENYQFSLQQLAANTRELLRSLGIEKVHVIGHSMGGMLAIRYGLMYPQETQSLTLVGPLGLEDWQAKGVPYATVEQLYEQELNRTTEQAKAYQLKYYYNGQWKPEYNRWIDLFAAFKKSPGYARMAWNQAQTSDMIFTQPVCYQFGQLHMPVLLMVGQTDRTAPGAERALPEIQRRLGDYPALGKAAAAVMPHAKFIEFEELGHAPQLQDFARFIKPVKEFLQAQNKSAPYSK